MCRYSYLRGAACMAFGIGLLIGCSMESGLWCCVLGVGAIVAGLVFCGTNCAWSCPRPNKIF